MGPRRGKSKQTANSEIESDENESDIEMNEFINLDKQSGIKTLMKKQQSYLDTLKAFKNQHKSLAGLQELVISVSNRFSLLADKKRKQNTNVNNAKSELTSCTNFESYFK